MDNQEIIAKVSSMVIPDTDYIVFSPNNENYYYGLDKDGCVVFMIVSTSSKHHPMCQETKSLRFDYNKTCHFDVEGIIQEKVMHVLVCKEKSHDKIEAFVRLTFAFSSQETSNDQYYLPKLFSSLSALFDKQRNISETEIQGLFSELYAILFLYRNGIDVSKYWQSQNRMKFDFSLSETKRLEIKSTTKTSRTHHFKHDQLLCELYDIVVVSIMLQKNDFGISLYDVVKDIRNTFVDNYALMLHIDSIITHIDDDQLSDYKYDRTYLEQNIKFFAGTEVPHFNEKSPDGVYNAEYDCCLDTSKALSEKELIDWIKEGYL